MGTSLPELTVSITAARVGKPEIAIGNVLGSNIFNSLAVMGISALFGTLLIPQSILTFALPLMLIATLLYLFITQDRQITKWEGWLLLLFYLFFIGKILNLF
ncbi:MAG: sodium:calcium antiporter [Candidatus Hydrothermarchaeales archaeon]